MPYCSLPQGSVGVGANFKKFKACGLIFDGSSLLLTNGPASVRAAPPLHAAEAKAVKSPARIAAVGAELVALQTVALRGKEVPRVEFVIAHELEQVAVKFIRARFSDDVDRRSGVM